MSQWKNDDTAGNSVSWGPALVNKLANTGNKTDLFGNVTPDAFVTGQIVGVFGVSAAEAGSSNGTIHQQNIIFNHNGSGYGANGTITVSGGTGNTTAAAGNAHANSSGRIDSILFTNNGVNYTSAPTITVSAPDPVAFNANSGVNDDDNTIAISTANSLFLVGDRVQYLVAEGNTEVTGLSNGSYYYVVHANTTVIALSETLGGANVDISNTEIDETGHTLTGETANVDVVLSRGKHVAHAGWVKRTVGTGGRAGRVHMETLVAMGSMTGDASDDTVFKDS